MNTYLDYKRIVINETPLIDVRTPKEFEKGAFFNTVNLPIMTDEEHHKVGLCYKKSGHDEAVKLGHSLVSGIIKEKRINSWKLQIEKEPNSLIYCFRGGSRSQIAQEWIKEYLNIDILRLENGFKEFRHYLIDSLDPINQKATPILLGGETGSGKTILLKKLKNFVDLEGIANHRGSSFGQQISSQPSQINFENNLAYALIQHEHNGYKNIILEDEGRNVGRCFLPKPLVAHFASGDLIVLKTPIMERVNITLKEYVIESQSQHIALYGEELGLSNWYDYILNSLNRITKRLGAEKQKELVDMFDQSYKSQLILNDYFVHSNWIKLLLSDYYDPMYNYQLKKASKKIAFTGNTQEVYEYLKEREL